ncbi:MAG: hypothetical protein M3308_09690 [Actinomycetota bacterium]|nr:hypothetical protein [Actinomycetota bacterium]
MSQILPPLNEAVDLAQGVAGVFWQLTGDPYGEPARSECEVGQALTEEGLGNPAAFAHMIIDWYAGATGDLLHGAGEMTREQYNLIFSSAALARSACEYAGIGCWLAEPTVSLRIRIARTAWLIDKSFRDAKVLLPPQGLRGFMEDNAPLLAWAQKNISKREKLPTSTARFQEMNPEHGKANYAYYSMLAHGDLIMTGKLVHGLADSNQQLPELWWRIVLACAQALNFATRISDLRNRRPDDLVHVYGLHQRYSALLDEYAANAGE